MSKIEQRFDRIAGHIDNLYDFAYSTMDAVFGVVDFVYTRARERALSHTSPDPEAGVEGIEDKLMLVVTYKNDTGSKDKNLWENMLKRGLYNVEVVEAEYDAIPDEWVIPGEYFEE